MISLSRMIPGQTALRESVERGLIWGENPGAMIMAKGVILATTVDARATPTTRLEPGLVMGKITASKKYRDYQTGSADGSEVAKGLLAHHVRMDDEDGTTSDKLGWFIVAGPIVEGETGGLDAGAKTDFGSKILWDTDF